MWQNYSTWAVCKRCTNGSEFRMPRRDHLHRGSAPGRDDDASAVIGEDQASTRTTDFTCPPLRRQHGAALFECAALSGSRFMIVDVSPGAYGSGSWTGAASGHLHTAVYRNRWICREKCRVRPTAASAAALAARSAEPQSTADCGCAALSARHHVALRRQPRNRCLISGWRGSSGSTIAGGGVRHRRVATSSSRRQTNGRKYPSTI